MAVSNSAHVFRRPCITDRLHSQPQQSASAQTEYLAEECTKIRAWVTLALAACYSGTSPASAWSPHKPPLRRALHKQHWFQIQLLRNLQLYLLYRHWCWRWWKFSGKEYQGCIQNCQHEVTKFIQHPTNRKISLGIHKHSGLQVCFNGSELRGACGTHWR